jgi:hypothetical protein
MQAQPFSNPSRYKCPVRGWAICGFCWGIRKTLPAPHEKGLFHGKHALAAGGCYALPAPSLNSLDHPVTPTFAKAYLYPQQINMFTC